MLTCRAMLVAFLGLLLSWEPSLAQTSPKGIWGRVTPIADTAHPNLLYNQAEIDQLRNLILVQHNPTLYNLYINSVQGVLSVLPDRNNTDLNAPWYQNGLAALSYMIEPTQAKATAIHDALMAYVNIWPNGGGVGGGDDWYQTQGWGFSGFTIGWAYDLVQAYHPNALSASEKTTLRNWLVLSATTDPGARYVDRPQDISTHEGITLGGYANWFTNYLMNKLPLALVSGNQAAVDFWADSGWPHTRLTWDGSNDPGPTTNRMDLVMNLLAMYPSGANADTYWREGFGTNTATGWYTNCYPCSDTFHRDGGGYHYFLYMPVALSAEMAFHNGMTQVFTGVPGTALLMGEKLGFQSKTQIDYRPSSETGHPDLWTYPASWIGQRRFSADPVIANGVGQTFDTCCNWESQIARELWPFLGFPIAAPLPPPGRAAGSFAPFFQPPRLRR